jgi:hypothetical protein
MPSTSRAGPKPKARSSAKAAPAVIGWREWAALPDLSVARIKAKIDTGAKTSALHAVRIRAFERSGAVFVRFVVRPTQRRSRPEIECVARVVDRRRIRSSNGQAESRYIVETTLALDAIAYPIELSLSDREQMGFRLLLGRDALKKRFLIDPARSFELGR